MTPELPVEAGPGSLVHTLDDECSRLGSMPWVSLPVRSCLQAGLRKLRRRHFAGPRDCVTVGWGWGVGVEWGRSEPESAGLLVCQCSLLSGLRGAGTGTLSGLGGAGSRLAM